MDRERETLIEEIIMLARDAQYPSEVPIAMPYEHLSTLLSRAMAALLWAKHLLSPTPLLERVMDMSDDDISAVSALTSLAYGDKQDIIEWGSGLFNDEI